MSPARKPAPIASGKARLGEALLALSALGFGGRQRNEVAGYTLLALLKLKPGADWKSAAQPLIGITPIITFIREAYGQSYAPNTRETIRDEAVKHFVESGLVLRNSDSPDRPTNSGRTVYQIHPVALALFRSYGTKDWARLLRSYLRNRATLRREILRGRDLARVPVRLPDGTKVSLSPGGQNPLIKAVVEEFCSRFLRNPTIVYLGDTESKFGHLEADYLAGLGVVLHPSAKMPDVVAHDPVRNWLLLIEAVTSAGTVDGKRRLELKSLFRGSKAGLVFVTAFQSRRAMQCFLTQISWETEVWVAEDPDHVIHFNGERFLGPYPDAAPATQS